MWYLEKSEDGDVMEQWNEFIEITKEIAIMNIDVLLNDYEKDKISGEEFLKGVRNIMSKMKEF